MSREPTSEAGSGATSDSARDQREAVRQRYGAIAAGDDAGEHGPSSAGGGCCEPTEPSGSSCCGEDDDASLARTLGYDAGDLASAPADANLGLGCGNPSAIAELQPGETVLDLGSGGGFDCFLAAREVGDDGRVIGVDMTPEMVERARASATEQGFESVEFRLGEIEHLPIPDAQVDVVISNCVINLSPAKERVFQEAYRVLVPGGHLAISDLVRTRDAQAADPEADPASLTGCLAGAAQVDDLREMLARVGFQSVAVSPEERSDAIIRAMYGDVAAAHGLQSAVIEGVKPSS